MGTAQRAHDPFGPRFGASWLAARAAYEPPQNLGFDAAFPHASHAAMVVAA